MTIFCKPFQINIFSQTSSKLNFQKIMLMNFARKHYTLVHQTNKNCYISQDTPNAPLTFYWWPSDDCDCGMKNKTAFALESTEDKHKFSLKINIYIRHNGHLSYGPEDESCHDATRFTLTLELFWCCLKGWNLCFHTAHQLLMALVERVSMCILMLYTVETLYRAECQKY